MKASELKSRIDKKKAIILTPVKKHECKPDIKPFPLKPKQHNKKRRNRIRSTFEISKGMSY